MGLNHLTEDVESQNSDLAKKAAAYFLENGLPLEVTDADTAPWDNSDLMDIIEHIKKKDPGLAQEVYQGFQDSTVDDQERGVPFYEMNNSLVEAIRGAYEKEKEEKEAFKKIKHITARLVALSMLGNNLISSQTIQQKDFDKIMEALKAQAGDEETAREIALKEERSKLQGQVQSQIQAVSPQYRQGFEQVVKQTDKVDERQKAIDRRLRDSDFHRREAKQLVQEITAIVSNDERKNIFLTSTLSTYLDWQEGIYPEL